MSRGRLTPVSRRRAALILLSCPSSGACDPRFVPVRARRRAPPGYAHRSAGHADLISFSTYLRNFGEKPNGLCAHHSLTPFDKNTVLMPSASAVTIPKSPAPKSACVYIVSQTCRYARMVESKRHCSSGLSALRSLSPESQILVTSLFRAQRRLSRFNASETPWWDAARVAFVFCRICKPTNTSDATTAAEPNV
jgi:hypothetical protein